MKLWQQSPAKTPSLVEGFTAGKDLELDVQLFPYDITGSKAHVQVLAKAGVLTNDEAVEVAGALDELQTLWAKGEVVITPAQEDCHTTIEEWLTAKLGVLGKKVHTGRSRNDQVATAIVLYEQAQLAKVVQEAKSLAEKLLVLAKANVQTPLPGYTHYQQAMPSTVALWAAGYAELLLQDATLVEQTKALVAKSPLGTAAGYGPSLTLNRSLAQEALGLPSLVVTATAAQPFRAKDAVLCLTALQQVMATLGKIAADLILYATKEFGFVTLPSIACTGSSIMPQKQNPDVLELVQGKAAVVAAKVYEAILVSQGLGGGYHRAYQLLKEPLFAGFDTTLDSLAVMQLVIDGFSFNEEQIIASFTPAILAADEATQLAVEQKVPFRDAYHKVKESLGTLSVVTKEQLVKNAQGKQTLGAPGNPGLEMLARK